MSKLHPIGVVLDDAQRLQWDFAPLVSVGPLEFGMTADQVAAALGPARATGPRTQDRYGGWGTTFHLPTCYGEAVTTYHAESGSLRGIAIDAVHGPQVTLGGFGLVGAVPSELEERFVEYMTTHRPLDRITCSQYRDLGADALGLVLRAQRAGDVVLSRPVFVGPEWAEMVCDAWEGALPEQEWRRYW